MFYLEVFASILWFRIYRFVGLYGMKLTFVCICQGATLSMNKPRVCIPCVSCISAAMMMVPD